MGFGNKPHYATARWLIFEAAVGGCSVAAHGAEPDQHCTQPQSRFLGHRGGSTTAALPTTQQRGPGPLKQKSFFSPPQGQYDSSACHPSGSEVATYRVRLAQQKKDLAIRDVLKRLVDVGEDGSDEIEARL